MSSIWPSALESLDRSVAALDEVLEKLDAAKPVDVAEMTQQLKAAEESSRKLRTMLLSELPDANWKTRDDLAALVAARDLEHQRSLLRLLAAELKKGNLVHRRAARVTQLNQLRDQAVDELHSFAEQPTAPPPLPGPQAEQWIEWACSLKEPEDAVSLQSLRDGFLYLDEFVASLEPGMWMVDGRMPLQAPPAPAQPEVPLEEQEPRRTRLTALAHELQRGSIHHHRALRVTQVNQLREHAIEELRALAVMSAVPPILPGPEPAQWVRWACNLKEPEDTGSIQALRSGFAHLDEFVANVEPDMWISQGSPEPPSKKGPPPDSGRKAQQEQAAPKKKAAQKPAAAQPAAVAVQAVAATASASAAAAPAPAKAPPVVTPVVPVEAPVVARKETPAEKEVVVANEESFEAESEKSAALAGVMNQARELWDGKRRMVLATAGVLVLAVVVAMAWTVRRTHASNGPVKPAETGVAVPAATTTPDPQPAETAPATTPAPTTGKDAKSKDTSNTNKQTTATPPPAPAEKQPQLVENTMLTPQAIPKANTGNKGEDATPPTLSIASAAPSGLANLVKSVPVSVPRVRASEGVAQGQLLHRVTPMYPSQARQSGIQGTVTLQALIAKDGKVQSVKIVRGPAMLTQAAVDAVKQWTYKPFMLNGEPAEADIQVSVNFTP